MLSKFFHSLSYSTPEPVILESPELEVDNGPSLNLDAINKFRAEFSNSMRVVE